MLELTLSFPDYIGSKYALLVRKNCMYTHTHTDAHTHTHTHTHYMYIYIYVFNVQSSQYDIIYHKTMYVVETG